MDNKNNPASQNNIQDKNTEDTVKPNPGQPPADQQKKQHTSASKSSALQPGTPEGGIGAYETYTPSPETTTPPEKLRTQETPKKSQKPEGEKTDESEKSGAETKPQKDEDLNIVDKTDELTSLHQIKETKQKLTSKADAEEEEFIHKVEAAHGHK